MLFVAEEIAGFTLPGWNSISYQAYHNPFLLWLIFVGIEVAGVWWLVHTSRPIYKMKTPDTSPNELIRDNNKLLIMELLRTIKIQGPLLTPYQRELKRLALKYGVPGPGEGIGGRGD